jgi:hypothetical protein
MLTGGMLLTRDDEVAGAQAAIKTATPMVSDASDATAKFDLT